MATGDTRLVCLDSAQRLYDALLLFQRQQHDYLAARYLGSCFDALVRYARQNLENMKELNASFEKEKNDR